MGSKIRAIESERDLPEDQYKSVNRGGATFKVKQVDFAETEEATVATKRSKQMSQKESNSMRNRMLQSDEIKQITDEHALSRHEVYNIRSQFTSMCKMSQQYEEEMKAKELGTN